MPVVAVVIVVSVVAVVIVVSVVAVVIVVSVVDVEVRMVVPPDAHSFFSMFACGRKKQL